MFFNPNVLAAVILGTALYYLGRSLARRVTSSLTQVLLVTILLLGCLPGLAFLAYYLHLFGEPLWYVEWRSQPYTEVLSALCAPFFGFLIERTAQKKQQRRRFLLLNPAIIGAFLVLVPFLKPIVLPVGVMAQWQDQWRDGVCLQSSPSTCGPASLATLLALYGVKRSERDIARGSYSCASGTELWYLMRYARCQQVPLQCLHEAHLNDIPAPAIFGVRTNGFGHFIVLFDAGNGRYTIGDPLTGRATLTEQEFRGQYQFGGCVLAVNAPENQM